MLTTLTVAFSGTTSRGVANHLTATFATARLGAGTEVHLVNVNTGRPACGNRSRKTHGVRAFDLSAVSCVDCAAFRDRHR